MEWKYEAIDILRNYEARQRALVNIPAEIERLSIEYEKIISAKKDGMPIKGGSNSRDDTLISNIAQRDILERNYKLTQKAVKNIARALSVLNEEETLILQRLYISAHKGGITRLCDELHVERASVYRKRDKALRHFTIAYYGAPESF